MNCVVPFCRQVRIATTQNIEWITTFLCTRKQTLVRMTSSLHSLICVPSSCFRNFSASFSAKRREANSSNAAVIDAFCTLFFNRPWTPELENSITALLPMCNAGVVDKVLRESPVDVSLQFFHWLKAQGFHHSFKTYHAIIDRLGEAYCLDVMKSMVHEMRKSNVPIRNVLYRDLMYWCACADDFEGVMSYWDELLTSKTEPSAAMCTSMIHALLKKRVYDAAVEVFSQMLEWKLDLNHRAFSLFIDELMRLGDLGTANYIVDKMEDLKLFPTMSTYSCLMALHAKAGNIVEIRDLAKFLRTVCDRPGSEFWHNAASLCIHGLWQDAMIFCAEVWPEYTQDEIKDKLTNLLESKKQVAIEGPQDFELEIGPLQVKRVDPDCIHVEKVLCSSQPLVVPKQKLMDIKWNNDMLYELLTRRIQNPLAAWQVFRFVEDEVGLDVDVFNQTAMLRTFSKKQIFYHLISLLSGLGQKGYKLSLHTFNSIILDCAFAKNVVVADLVFEKVPEFNLQPNEDTYSALLDAYLMGKKLTKAIEIWQKMQQAGYMPDSFICTFLICTLGMSGHTATAQSVLVRLLESGHFPCVDFYPVLIEVFSRAESGGMTLQTYYTMMHSEVGPSPVTMQAMSWFYLQSGDHEKMRECMRLLKENQEPSKPLCNSKKVLMEIKKVLSMKLTGISSTCAV